MCSCSESQSVTQCKTSTPESCPCDENRISIINPKTINPIYSCEPASNKYSLELEIKSSSSGSVEKSVRGGVAIGATSTDLVANMHSVLTTTTIEIIKAVVGTTYFSTAIPATGPITAVANNYLTLIAFENLFLTGANIATVAVVVNTLAYNQIKYIADAMFHFYSSITNHVPDSVSTVEVCAAAGSSRVMQASINNCLFRLKLIYN